MRVCLACVLLFTACAGRFRTELVGQGRAAIVPRGMAATPSGSGIALPRGTYDLALHFDLPHAQIIEWSVTCEGANVTGSVGESFDAYRARRFAQLRQQRDRDRSNVASLTGAVIGAVTPSVQGHVETATASADARVSGPAAGRVAGTAIANATIDDVIELPPGDFGQGRLQALAHVTTQTDGMCAVTAVADETTVVGSFEITRVRDLDAEARLRMMAAITAARQVRTQLSTQLVGYGADVTLRKRQLEAQAQARARVASSEPHGVDHPAEEIAISVRERSIALNTRAELRAQLVMWGADPDRRARLVARVQAEREAREARARLELELRERESEQREARARLEIATRDRERAEHEAAVAAFEARREQLALSVRAELRGYLVSLGARERPPMPPPRIEVAGNPPFDGAVWIGGKWHWDGNVWTWDAGGWRDQGRFHETGGDIAVGATFVEVSVPIESTIRDQRSESAVAVPAEPTIRDHRDERPIGPTIRDHRDEHPVGPTIRDHRDERPTAPTDREHRPGNAASTGADKPVARDHRR